MINGSAASMAIAFGFYHINLMIYTQLFCFQNN